MAEVSESNSERQNANAQILEVDSSNANCMWNSNSDRIPWITWMHSLLHHNLFVEVDFSFISDNFNLFGLRNQFLHFDAALKRILSSTDSRDSNFLLFSRDKASVELYGLIHARFIQSPRGLYLMRNKYLEGVYGTCPRRLCNNYNLLPIGLSDCPNTGIIHYFCPLCQEVYNCHPDDCNLKDGCFFGVSFPHIFLQHFTELVPLAYPEYHVPKVYGFRCHNRQSKIKQKIELGHFGRIDVMQNIKSNKPATEQEKETIDSD